MSKVVQRPRLAGLVDDHRGGDDGPWEGRQARLPHSLRQVPRRRRARGRGGLANFSPGRIVPSKTFPHHQGAGGQLRGQSAGEPQRYERLGLTVLPIAGRGPPQAARSPMPESAATPLFPL
jgi:hypothetical protein